MSSVTPSESAPETLALWREVLDAMTRQDSLGYLRRRCVRPTPASVVCQRLTSEQRALCAHLDALAPREQALAVGEELAAFFADVLTLACRWSVLEGDEAVVWPWADPAPGPHPPLPPLGSLAILQHATRVILSELDLRKLLPLLVDRAAALTLADAAFLALVDPMSGAIEVVESRGLGTRLARTLEVSTHERAQLLDGLEARRLPVAALPGVARLLGDAAGDTVLVAPLRYQDAPLGMIVCAGGGQGDAAEFLSILASQTAIAIRNAAHYREVVHKAAALHEANDQLRGLDRMKDEFLATVSHELRTPLNFITGFGSILLDEEDEGLSDEQRYFIKSMMDGAFQLLALVNDLLDYSRIRSGKLPLNFAPCELAPLLHEAHDLFRRQAGELSLALSLTLPASLPLVSGDRQRLSQVLTNLLSNAMKFTPAGGRIELAASVEAGVVRLSVTDTGVGIRADQIPLLFHRFSQLESGSTRQTGTGLGLAICKSLVEAHGGAIGVASPGTLDPAKGSTFWFTLPLA